MEITRFRYKAFRKTMLADLHTPVDVYLKLRDLSVQSVLMECSDYHDAANSRSFIALCPLAHISVGHGVAELQLPSGQTVSRTINGSCRTEHAFRQFLSFFDIEGEGSEYCGLYGYTSFNAVRYFENIEVKDETMDQNDAPDILYTLFRDVLVFDHFNNELSVVTLLPSAADAGEAERRLSEILGTIDHGKPQLFPFSSVGGVASTLTDDEHRRNIRRGIRHCLRGDVFQIVLSRRFVQKYEGDDFQLYRSLRSINPSPYLFYFDFSGFRLIGSSPETHCRIQEGRVYIDPIAGTARRTGNAEADQRAASYLRHDPKENAEHVMLVDLARNDLSRNCNSVSVEFYKDLQFYSHVVHLVSRVSGKLNEGADTIKTFIDTFPAGTLSGAPKVRAMQLISQYEPHCRGAYGGCVGYIGMDGSLNQAITIRTFVSRNGELWFQAGGGIVAKSDVEYELQEVNNKLGALRAAIEKAAKL